ncbi:MAG: arsenate reductase ArsC [Gammaproteobacteria bacterium]|nr:arsenate reductase ArsC [Gammaproteobacteria bacterium]
MANDKCSILFLCTGNSCRSQMAESWLKHLHTDRYEAYSAGIEAHGLNMLAVKAMAEVGIDIGKYKSKTVDELPVDATDYVISVCGHADKNCPVLPAKIKRLHIGFDDPPKLAADAKNEEEAMQHYRRVRDEIRTFIEQIDSYLKKDSYK